MTLLEKFAKCTKKIEEEYGSNIYPETSQMLKSEGFTKYFFSDSLSDNAKEELAKALWDLDDNHETQYSAYDIGAMDIFYFRENTDHFDIIWVDAATEKPTKHYIMKNEIADLVVPFMKDIEPYYSFEDRKANNDFKNPRHTLAKMEANRRYGSVISVTEIEENKNVGRIDLNKRDK